MSALDRMVSCSYERSHRIDPARLAIHHIKCAKNHKHLNMVICPFNAVHVVPSHQLQAHLEDCPYSDAVLRSLVQREEDSSSSSSSDSDSEDPSTMRGEGHYSTSDGALGGQTQDTEEWVIDPASPTKRGYDPQLASFLKPFARKVPSGLSKTARTKWSLMEKKRVRELQDGVPFSAEVRSFLGIPDHLVTDMSSIHLADNISSTAGHASASTSIQQGAEKSQQPMRRPRTSNPACPPSYVTVQHQQSVQQERQQVLEQRREVEAKKRQTLEAPKQQPSRKQKVAQQKQPAEPRVKLQQHPNYWQEVEQLPIATSVVQQRHVLQPPAMVNRARLVQSFVSRPLQSVAKPPPTARAATQQQQPQPRELCQQHEQQQVQEEQQQQPQYDSNPHQEVMQLRREVDEKERLIASLRSQLEDARNLQLSPCVNQGGSTVLPTNNPNEVPMVSFVQVDNAPFVGGSLQTNAGYYGNQFECPTASDTLYDYQQEGNGYTDAVQYNGFGEGSVESLCTTDHYYEDPSAEFVPQEGKLDIQQGTSYYEGDPQQITTIDVTSAVNDDGTSSEYVYDASVPQDDNLNPTPLNSEYNLDNGLDSYCEREYGGDTRQDMMNDYYHTGEHLSSEHHSFTTSVEPRIDENDFAYVERNLGESDPEYSVGGSNPNIGGVRSGNPAATSHSLGKHSEGKRSSKNLNQSSEDGLFTGGSQNSLNDRQNTSCNSSRDGSFMGGSRGSLNVTSSSGPCSRAPAPGTDTKGDGPPATAASAADCPALGDKVEKAVAPSNLPRSSNGAPKSFAEVTKSKTANHVSLVPPVRGGIPPSSGGLLRGVGRGFLDPNWSAPRNARGTNSRGKGWALRR